MEVGWQAQTEEVLLKMFYNLSQTLYVLGRRTESFEIIKNQHEIPEVT